MDINLARPDSTYAEGRLGRAQGCLLGQLTGDALGSLVEFKTSGEIHTLYPRSGIALTDGGTWNTLAGQPTDDSEMALLLARMLAKCGTYDATQTVSAYQYWLASRPFDCGTTIRQALHGHPNCESQANGAMMRVSPLGIFAAGHSLAKAAQWARQDASLTHPHQICVQANVLFVQAIACAIRTPTDGRALYGKIVMWAKDAAVAPELLQATLAAADRPPQDYLTQQGWVLIAWQNALWQLLHAKTLRAGVESTVMCGGDTDTNAAIAGALLGAVHGLAAIPEQWRRCVLGCRPQVGQPGVHRPRPECFWPTDALDLAQQVLAAGTTPP